MTEITENNNTKWKSLEAEETLDIMQDLGQFLILKIKIKAQRGLIVTDSQLARKVIYLEVGLHYDYLFYDEMRQGS